MIPETTSAAGAATENFADMLAESFGENTSIEGSVVRGFVISLEGDAAIIDVGLKSEGRVPLKELAGPGQEPNINVGDEIEVYVERMEDKNGQAVLSRDKARREEAWGLLEASFEKQERVTGVIFGKVKGGFTVDLSGATAFLPGSQVDIRPVRDLGPLMGTPQPFQILKPHPLRFWRPKKVKNPPLKHLRKLLLPKSSFTPAGETNRQAREQALQDRTRRPPTGECSADEALRANQPR